MGWVLLLKTNVSLRGRNPTLEEQALGRIHRIGQDKEVTTVRFFIRDSFEEVRDFSSPFYNTSPQCVVTPFYLAPYDETPG